VFFYIFFSMFYKRKELLVVMGNKVVKYAAGLLTAGVLGTAAIAQMVAVAREHRLRL